VGHGSEVVDLVGTNIGDDSNKIGGITKISVVKEKFDSSLMPIPIDMINASSVERRGAPNDSVHLLK
jgi:hypothetical protein